MYSARPDCPLLVAPFMLNPGTLLTTRSEEVAISWMRLVIRLMVFWETFPLVRISLRASS